MLPMDIGLPDLGLMTPALARDLCAILCVKAMAFYHSIPEKLLMPNLQQGKGNLVRLNIFLQFISERCECQEPSDFEI